MSFGGHLSAIDTVVMFVMVFFSQKEFAVLYYCLFVNYFSDRPHVLVPLPYRLLTHYSISLILLLCIYLFTISVILLMYWPFTDLFNIKYTIFTGMR